MDPLGHIRDWHDRLGETGWWHSFEFPDGGSIQGVLTLAAQKMRIAQFPIPQDLTGKRVLDIGTWDGWFAMEMERRGAEVVAIDRFENPRFLEIHERLRSRVDYRQLSVYDLDPNKIGRFDIVLFMGVFYHLKHPLLALERVCSVARDLVVVESFVLQGQERLLMEFYENDEFGGEFDNWVVPSVPCLMAMCRTAGFARVEVNHVHEYGAALSCFRTWKAASAPKTSMELLAVFHAEDRGVNFRSSSSDEYLICRIGGAAAGLTLDSVQPEVAGFGVRPVFVGMVEGYCQVSFPLPPGLPAGWHPVRITTADAESNSLPIAVDIPLAADSLSIVSVSDGVSWEPFRVSKKNGFVSLWVRGLPENADVNNVRVYMGGKRQVTDFVGAAGEDGIRQVNAKVHPGTALGVQKLKVGFGGCEAPEVEMEVVDAPCNVSVKLTN
jgi:tRNA (mo5U34)-methyltransferase